MSDFGVEQIGEVMAGPVRRPDNFSKAAVGSIHDDATAHKLGFRGGTVVANIHFEQFPPLMDAAFGPSWIRTGGLSLYFMNATTDGEPVQAFVARPQDVPGGLRRAETWMQDAAERRVCEGTASLGGPDPQSGLRRRLADARPAQDLRMLRTSIVGDQVQDIPARLDGKVAIERLKMITEPLAAYRDAAPYGEVVAAPSIAIDALRAVEGPLFRTDGPVVGMFGAIELQFLDGPVFVDHDYLADGRVVALGESPKTEVVWYESTLKDAADGRPVAQLLMMSRLLKASSPLWD